MDNNLFEMFENYKIVVYIPKSDSNQIIERLLDQNLNKIGNYYNCVSWSNVRSTWMPIGEANPYIGEKNKRSFEDEVRLELVCKREDVKRIVEQIKKIHPYDEAEIDIIPIFTKDDFLR
ncbi:divalent cation tolerance protein CutA [Butyrivibrio sp. FCS014]|uniref:divalent cation tolerance protein CutA n=1 Tax=Butyrivibrio sp. FCS014 TaxID=1408304 RepID=UPI000467EC90|nr:divalent cation tolerance protein CutA [Butyrivibrio sp. FCS014]